MITPNALQLIAIKAAIRQCYMSIEEFRQKITKFDRRLGLTSADHNGVARFARRMQWTLLYRDDIASLRSTLAGQVATINLLLLTRLVSISRSSAKAIIVCYHVALRSFMCLGKKSHPGLRCADGIAVMLAGCRDSTSIIKTSRTNRPGDG
jgi:hypothetical protein